MTRRKPTVRAQNAALWFITGCGILFVVLPLVVVIPQSFNASSIIQFPPTGFTLNWYNEFFTDSFWISAFWLSVKLALAVAFTSTLLAFMAVLALARLLTVGRRVMRVLVLLPMIVPTIVVAIALFDISSRLHLVGSFWGLLLCHTILALPFPFVVLDNAMRSIDPGLEQAALSLGASRVAVIFKVTIPLMSQSLGAAALFAFLTSWDEVIVVLFVGGASAQTLPLKMFQFLTTEVRPTVGAVSALLIVVLAVAIAAAKLYGMLGRKNRQIAVVRG